MHINLAPGGDLEAGNETEVEEVKQAIGQRDARAATVAETVSEEWCLGLLQPTFGPENVRVVWPESWI